MWIQVLCSQFLPSTNVTQPICYWPVWSQNCSVCRGIAVCTVAHIKLMKSFVSLSNQNTLFLFIWAKLDDSKRNSMLILRPICMYSMSFRKLIYSPEIHRFPYLFLYFQMEIALMLRNLSYFRQSLREWILVLEAVSCDREDHQPRSQQLPGCEQIDVIWGHVI